MNFNLQAKIAEFRENAITIYAYQILVVFQPGLAEKPFD